MKSSIKSGVRMASSARNSERSNKSSNNSNAAGLLFQISKQRRARAVGADETVQPRQHAVGVGEDLVQSLMSNVQSRSARRTLDLGLWILDFRPFLGTAPEICGINSRASSVVRGETWT